MDKGEEGKVDTAGEEREREGGREGGERSPAMNLL